MKKLFLILLLALSACTAKTPVASRKTVDQLQVLLKDYDASAFDGSVSTAYSLFPISFADSNGDGKGDLQGIISKLDYLNDGNPKTTTDLGVDAVWLNPIYPSDTYHKYDIKDYEAIDPTFGTMDDFKQLVAAMHQRGIKLILDMVFNHTSDQHPWFLQGIAGKAPYDQYYMIKTKINMKDYPSSDGWYGMNSRMYYAGFWNKMPDLNSDSDLVRTALHGVLDFWMNLGVDGFRFDAATSIYSVNEYPKGTPVVTLNKQYWMEMKEYVKSKNKDVYMVGEVWQATSLAASYASGFDSMFDFDLAQNIITAVNNGASTDFMTTYLNGQKAISIKTDHYLDAIFLSNHDQNRVMSQLSNDVGKAKLAANILFTLPGVPFVYYGEELGMAGMKPDENIREPFVWSHTHGVPLADWETTLYNKTTATYAQQVVDPNSMFTLYRNLIDFRKNSDILRFGDIQSIPDLSAKILGFTRSYNGKTLIILHNLSKETQVVALTQNAKTVYSFKNVSVKGQTVTMAAESSVILEVN